MKCCFAGIMCMRYLVKVICDDLKVDHESLEAFLALLVWSPLKLHLAIWFTIGAINMLKSHKSLPCI